MKYKVALHRSDEGISVSVPALPGCWSEGDTEEEALAIQVELGHAGQVLGESRANPREEKCSVRS